MIPSQNAIGKTTDGILAFQCSPFFEILSLSPLDTELDIFKVNSYFGQLPSPFDLKLQP